MKVLIKSIKMATEYKDSKEHDLPDRRDITTTVQDSYEREAKFRLPAIEVDGVIVVGGIYELVFARRES